MYSYDDLLIRLHQELSKHIKTQMSTDILGTEAGQEELTHKKEIIEEFEKNKTKPILKENEVYFLLVHIYSVLNWLYNIYENNNFEFSDAFYDNISEKIQEYIDRELRSWSDIENFLFS